MTVTVADRFWQRVRRTDSCWFWTGTRTESGYGFFRVQGRKTRAHRYAFELLRHPIPDDLVIDHLCRTRDCVNPAHMDVVTPAVNVLRGEGISAVNARKTHCKRGHPFNTANTLLRKSGKRECRVCHRDRIRRLSKPKGTR